LQSIAVCDVCRLCFLERGEKVACGCDDLVLPEPFKIGNNSAQLDELLRTRLHNVLRRRQLLQEARCLPERAQPRSSRVTLPANQI
jgi:hypothetical protein